eukprot:3153479-Rhodomonas_salina.1
MTGLMSNSVSSQCANTELMIRGTLSCMEENECCSILDLSGSAMLQNPRLGSGGSPCPDWPTLTCGEGETGAAGAFRSGPLLLLALLGGCMVLMSGKRA